MNNCRKLSTYSTEMLKIRSKLYPDSQRVADAIYGQIEMMVDLIIDIHSATVQSGMVRPLIMVYKPTATTTTFSASYPMNGQNVMVVMTIDHEARVVHVPFGQGLNVDTVRLYPEDLMKVHQVLVEIYNHFCGEGEP